MKTARVSRGEMTRVGRCWAVSTERLLPALQGSAIKAQVLERVGDDSGRGWPWHFGLSDPQICESVVRLAAVT